MMDLPFNYEMSYNRDKNEEKFYSFMNSAEEVRKVIKDNYSK